MSHSPLMLPTTHPIKFIESTEETLKVSEDVHIASIVIQCKPEHQNNIEAYCRSKPDFHVYEANKQGTFVLVIETVSEKNITRTIDNLNYINGVISTSLVYHHCEPKHSLEEDMSL